ncbi:efflux RND transporter periplasmic adaptor subunit [Thermocoleostomius sinensis]|jgi:HlyD family secretion protein|uniref:Efflux RND transporter periplasmic adaptor subunit n=1 Tax=Thermocoleostomius sinensis A174 TaxID=2016057 RepID=A0A9E9C6M9_9CYAN|nr:efflux RND transporter periplasmic adaptor subunit [Thermocoleostomius sinensis]WAL62431.1 efflux RND transporter periplasmic adaptor subunit [Thermocoleostomius sinensis A174]
MQLSFLGKRYPNPWILGLVTAGLLGVGGLTYWTVRNQSAVPDVSTMTVTVDSQPLQVRIGASGRVQPIQTVNLSPKTSGILVELLVEQGDRVSQGQVVARMEYESVEARLAQSRARVAQAEARLSALRSGNRPEEIARAEAQVAQAEARVAEAQAQVNRADERVRRNQSLASEGAISTDDLDDVLNQAETARANLAQSEAALRESQRSLELVQRGARSEDIAEAQAQLAEAQADLRSVQVEYDDTFIRAPFDGIITQKYASEGAFVTPTTSASEASSATSTAIVALAEGLEVLAEVPEVDIQQLRVGQPVEIVADAYPGQVFRGEVLLIAPEAVVDQNVTSFQVRIALTSGEDKLLSGMNVDVTFLGDEMTNALVVPTVAIVTRDGETGVLVPNETNQPEFRPVMLGTSVGNQTQILEGLQPGERVFTDIPPNSQWDQTEE